MSDINNIKDLASFKRAQETMIATSDTAWNSWEHRYSNISRKIKDYTIEDVVRILESGSAIEQQVLSRNYFYKDGFYRKIILYYATLLKYNGLVIPNSDKTNSLSKKNIEKRYIQGIDYVENMKIPDLCVNFSWRALVDGAYYGVVVNADKENFSVMDLPFAYCRSRYKDLEGNDILEFNVSYFLTIPLEEDRAKALAAYPKIITQYYKKWVRSKDKISCWCVVPAPVGICFILFDGHPLFLNVIPATIQYDDAVETEREREIEEIRKIIVQKIPHLTDGGLLFEPDEAVEIHDGTVKMMKHNKNVSVLTTYADVDAIVSNTANEANKNSLEKMMQNIYAEAGVSSQLFAATGNLSIEISIKNDTALMMVLANKYANFITSILNRNFANKNLQFKYTIFPITYYNDSDFITDSFKLAQSGYSFLLPSLALGLSQKDLINIKELENDVLDLPSRLIPLQSAYTQSGSGEGPGRPTLPNDKKSAKTIANERSLDAQGGAES